MAKNFQFAVRVKKTGITIQNFIEYGETAKEARTRLRRTIAKRHDWSCVELVEVTK